MPGSGHSRRWRPSGTSSNRLLRRQIDFCNSGSQPAGIHRRRACDRTCSYDAAAARGLLIHRFDSATASRLTESLSEAVSVWRRAPFHGAFPKVVVEEIAATPELAPTSRRTRHEKATQELGLVVNSPASLQPGQTLGPSYNRLLLTPIKGARVWPG